MPRNRAKNRTAKQIAEDRNIARIARKVQKAELETKATREQVNQTEIKYHHEMLINFHELTCTNQGVNNRQRIGNSVSPNRIHMRLLLRNSDDADSVDASVRVLVLKCKEPKIESEFNFLNPALPNDGYAQMLDEDTVIVKYDRTHMLGAFTGASRSDGYSPFKSIDLTFRGIGKVEFEGNGDSDAAVNPWYLVLYRCDNSGAATGRAGYVLASRMYFKDA